MHYYGLLKQRLRHLINAAWPRWEIYPTLLLLISYCITIMGTVWFILHILFINTIVSFYTALPPIATLPSIATRIRYNNVKVRFLCRREGIVINASLQLTHHNNAYGIFSALYNYWRWFIVKVSDWSWSCKPTMMSDILAFHLNWSMN